VEKCPYPYSQAERGEERLERASGDTPFRGKKDVLYKIGKRKKRKLVDGLGEKNGPDGEASSKHIGQLSLKAQSADGLETHPTRSGTQYFGGETLLRRGGFHMELNQNLQKPQAGNTRIEKQTVLTRDPPKATSGRSGRSMERKRRGRDHSCKSDGLAF